MKKRITHFLQFLCFCIAGLVAVAQAQTYSVVSNLGSSPGDPTSISQMTQGRDGLLYGEAEFGGTYGNGTVFRMAPNGSFKVLYSFQSSEGYYPGGGLTLGVDGFFYGLTHSGGAYNRGTIFRITPTGTLATLHHFTTNEVYQASAAPATFAQLVQGLDGNFYGTTADGGTLRDGIVYKISPKGQFAVLYQFDGNLGLWPSGLVLGTDGAFYGISAYGPNNNGYGAIFKITPFGQFTVVHSFSPVDGPPASLPYQGLDGNFYGTSDPDTSRATAVVYRMTPTGNVTILRGMDGAEGNYPSAGLIQGSDGIFYGANSYEGPSATCADLGGCGTLFKITPQGVFTALFDLDYPTGATPETTMVQHTSGVFYGSTTNGGSGTNGPYCSFNCGVLYSFNAGLPPFVTLSPVSGKPGSAVVILGQGFSSAMSVTFNNVAASFALVSSTCVIATVPAQASTGRVQVSISKTNALFGNRKFTVN